MTHTGFVNGGILLKVSYENGEQEEKRFQNSTRDSNLESVVALTRFLLETEGEGLVHLNLSFYRPH